jgi:hypothetical protein
MKLIAMMPLRNEAWIAGLSIRVALQWCDEVVALNHSSTDQTAEICHLIGKEYYERFRVWETSEGNWPEMAHRQALLQHARERGATHVAIVDADEILTGNLLPTIRQAIEAMPRGYCLQLPGYNLREGIDKYHSNGVWGNRWFSVAFADDARLHWAGERFHHREPMGAKLLPYRPIAHGEGGVMHLWASSLRRLHEKHRLYRVTEALQFPEKSRAEIEHMYSLAERGDPSNAAYGTPGTWTYRDVPPEWWATYKPLMQYLDVGAYPWQRAEVERLIAEHGRERFSGLTL